MRAKPGVEREAEMTAVDDSGTRSRRNGPEIVEYYRDYIPPAQVKNIVQNLLKGVPKPYLSGLGTVVLTNRSALTRDQKRQRVWSRNRKGRLVDARGAYYRATAKSPATVWLIIDNIQRPEPALIFRVPIAAYDLIGKVLYHEIGHHIHAAIEPIYEGKENVADDWSDRLWRRFSRRRYWYLMPIAYPVRQFSRLWKRLRKATAGPPPRLTSEE